MSKIVLIQLFVICVLLISSPSFCQDISPLRKYHIWLPMTGVNERQMDDAHKAGYDTMMLKVHPPLKDNKIRQIDFSPMDKLVDQAIAKGFNVLLPVLGWVGLGNGYYWDMDESGEKIPNQLDPFWPEAMDQVEWYYKEVMEHYKSNPHVVAFAPTWGIYGEAGFTSFTAGRSKYALARFNEWRVKQGYQTLDKLPDRKNGPNTEWNQFIRFRYTYMEEQFDSMIKRLKKAAGSIPVGMWQEMYPVIGYLWTMVEVPSADFALYESCFPFQSNHHTEKSLGETMGFRYRCSSPEDYRNYYLPLLARKHGEGQRFMGCQLTNDYAVQSYGWTMEQAEKAQFDRFEDEFSPYLKKLLNEPLESPERDVLLVFPTYSAAALTDNPSHGCDAMLIDVLLRMYGCQMVRYGSPRLDKMSLADMDRFKLIIVPDAAFLTRETYEKLNRTRAAVVMTGCPAQSLNGVYTPEGQSRTISDLKMNYFVRPAGGVDVAGEHPLTRGLKDLLKKQDVKIPIDESFRYENTPADVDILMSSAGDPLVSTRKSSKTIFIHGHIFADLCYNPDRKVPDLGGSKDASANEVDMWGPYDSTHPQNAFGYQLMKNILDYAGVDYRVMDPKPRTVCPFIGDHMEPVSISANIVYNNTPEPQTIIVRTPFKPKGYLFKTVNGRYETKVTVPRFSYIALRPASNSKW